MYLVKFNFSTEATPPQNFEPNTSQILDEAVPIIEVVPTNEYSEQQQLATAPDASQEQLAYRLKSAPGRFCETEHGPCHKKKKNEKNIGNDKEKDEDDEE